MIPPALTSGAKGGAEEGGGVGDWLLVRLAMEVTDVELLVEGLDLE